MLWLLPVQKGMDESKKIRGVDGRPLKNARAYESEGLKATVAKETGLRAFHQSKMRPYPKQGTPSFCDWDRVLRDGRQYP